jgi:hypothetical protein
MVAEADWMLSDLAKGGHLEVKVNLALKSVPKFD